MVKRAALHIFLFYHIYFFLKIDQIDQIYLLFNVYIVKYGTFWVTDFQQIK